MLGLLEHQHWDTRTVYLITETDAAERLMSGECVQCGYSGQRDDSCLSGSEQFGVRCHGATQNGVQFKT